MYQKNPNRLDPMNNVMHYELLKVAHSLMETRQNKAYWDAVRVPKQPVGQVRYEVARQVATFAVPLMVLVWAYQSYYLLGLLLGAPVAWFVGFMLDLWLKRDIAKKRIRDDKIDAGRFRKTWYLADQMGMTPAEITLPIIYKMAADFRAVDSRMKAADLKAEADRKEAIARSVSRRPYKGSANDAAGVAAGTGIVLADTFADSTDDDAFSYLGGVNPSSGLPLIQGTMMDVGGNVYGMNDM